MNLVLIGLFPHLVGSVLQKSNSKNLFPTFSVGAIVLWSLCSLSHFGLELHLIRWVAVFISLASLLWWFKRCFRKEFASTLLVLSGIVLLLVFVGAYYEIPSDPLEHLLKIYHSPSSKFSYTWYRLALSSYPRADPFFLSLWQGLAGALLAFSFFRLGSYFSQSPWIGWLCVLSSLLFFGTNCFSYYRYYPFSAALFCYLVFLDGLGIIVSVFLERQSPRLLALLLPMALLIQLNHTQELVFLVLSFSVGLFIVYGIPRSVGFSVLILVAALTIKTKGTVFYHWPVSLNDLDHSSVHQTLGVPGYLAIVVSFLGVFIENSKRKKFIFSLTLGATALVFFPPSLYFIEKLFPNFYIIYRVFYGSLYWLSLPIGLISLGSYFGMKTALGGTCVGFVILGLSALPFKPIYSRVKHLLFQVPPAYDTRVYIDGIQFLQKQKADIEQRRCTIGSDTNGRLAISLYSDLDAPGDRTTLSSFSQPLRHYHYFLKELREGRVCYIVIRKPIELPPSQMGSLTGHWDPEFSLPNKQVLDRYLEVFWERAEFRLVYSDDYLLVFKTEGIVDEEPPFKRTKAF